MKRNNLNDIVLSSRIRLARNIEGLNFASKLDLASANMLPRKVYEALGSSDTYLLYRMKDISEIDAHVLKEKHLISEDLIFNAQTGSAIINERENVSILVNEEDHIRLQCIERGFSLADAHENLRIVDNLLSKKMKFAYSKKLGYITACPTNIGTGMRSSVMMFLPGLAIFNNLEKCLNAIARLNMAIRGVYGEGSSASGYIFQLSNQKTLGLTSEQIIEAVEASCGHVIEAEYRARDSLYKTSPSELKDKIWRAYGVLTNAYSLTSSEFMELFALVKLGIYYDFIKTNNIERLDTLLVNAQSYSISSLSGKNLDTDERDNYRASYVAKVLSQITKR
ncbi:MAG: ATP--guanido phosphotransferase [Firmicutes bacterium]|nr:ATP--guanido phosphotransferase [Bacillota bacterium]